MSVMPKSFKDFHDDTQEMINNIENESTKDVADVMERMLDTLWTLEDSIRDIIHYSEDDDNRRFDGETLLNDLKNGLVLTQ